MIGRLIKGFAFAGALALPCLAIGQDKNLPKEYYQAATIPDSLKKDVHVVTRYSYQEIVIKAPGREVVKMHDISTILDEKGDKAAQMMLPYNKKFGTIDDVEMRVYNAGGQLIKKYKKSDMYDHSAVDGFSLYTDDRVLLLEHTVASYPCTIETVYTEDNSSYMNVGRWKISDATDDNATQLSICKIVVNPAIGFRYKNKNTDIAPEKSTQDGMDVYTWQVENLKAEKSEESGVPDWLSTKSVEFAADKFEYYGIPGEMNNWQNYGKWIGGLTADVNSLSPARAAEIKAMTDTIKSDKDKARFLYRYMQQNMRYVSVQLGIGGLKPFPATFVDEKKYGDCKALVNYMYALLKAAGVPSYYAVVQAGTNGQPADPAFTYDSFNHIILCMPMKGDTTWLECTNMQQPFGKLGSFTENRNAVLITEDGGKLVNTPRSIMAENSLQGLVHLRLFADGSAKANIKLQATGDDRELYTELAAQKVDFQKSYLMKNLKIRQPSVFELKDAPDVGGVKETDMELEYDSFCDLLAGNKQFYRPSVLDLWSSTLKDSEKRKYDYYFDYPMQKSCVTIIDLPQDFDIESLPADVSLKFTYGDYQASYKYDAAKNQVTSTTHFNLNNQIVPAAKYAEMQAYMENIAKAQNRKLVIKRKG